MADVSIWEPDGQFIFLMSQVFALTHFVLIQKIFVVFCLFVFRIAMSGHHRGAHPGRMHTCRSAHFLSHSRVHLDKSFYPTRLAEA